MEDLETWLERVYQADGDRDTLDALYDEWAEDYDQQLWASGNPYIAIAAGFVGRHVPDFDARILDAGCGTGNMAQILHQMGYRNIDGLDPSSGMLSIAERKQIYQNLYPLSLGARIDIPDGTYDAVVAAGVLVRLLDPQFEALSSAVWWAFLRLSDPGYLGDDEGLASRAVSTSCACTNSAW